MMVVICPGSMSYDASSPDQALRSLTLFFGLATVYSPLLDSHAGTLSDVVNRRGRGQPGAYCERSGNYFPEERLVVDGDGRVVGDKFWTSGTPRTFEGDDDILGAWR